MEFDLESLSPTFRLISGLPGRSNALVIAEGLGLPKQILEDARGMVPLQDLVADDLLDELHRSRDEAQKQLLVTTAMREELEERLQDLHTRLNGLDEERRAILLEARQEAETQLVSLNDELKKLRGQLQRAGKELIPLDELKETVQELEKRFLVEVIEPVIKMPEMDWNPGLGDVVWLEKLGTKGLIIEIDVDEVLLQIGSMRVRARIEDLAPAREDEIETPVKERNERNQTNSLPTSPGLELDLRGQRVKEAVEHLERYLDAASAAGLPFGRIIHGKGTGALRRAVRERLIGHPLIERAHTAPPNEGGDGVTIARLVTLT